MKSYFRYEPSQTLGLIHSSHCSSIEIDTNKGTALCGGLDRVLSWSLRTSDLTMSYGPSFDPHRSISKDLDLVTIIQKSSSSSLGFSVGTVHGEIYLYEDEKGEPICKLHGHRSAILSLSYGDDGKLLASGSADSDIIVWDLISQTGLCRLRGHKDAVTGVAFFNKEGSRYLASVSKDTLLRIWDLSTEHCIQTVVGHRSEIWALTVLRRDGQDVALLTGSGDDILRGYSIVNEEEVAINEKIKDEQVIVKSFGQFQRHPKSGVAKDRITSIVFHEASSLIGISSSGKSIEVFTLQFCSL